MTESYGIFDSADGDSRTYAASVLCGIIAKFLRDGIVHDDGDELAVVASDPAAMTVEVGTGTAIVQGRYYVNDADLPLNIAAADPSYPRIDRIILRLNATPGRTIHAVVLQGTAAPSPTAPALTRTTETYELSLAQVAVGAGVTSIISANITDERGDASLCGDAVPVWVPSTQLQIIENLNANEKRLTNLGAPVNAADAATMGFALAQIAAAISGFAISDIPIDEDKDWNGKDLTNVKNLVATTATFGGIVVSNPTIKASASDALQASDDAAGSVSGTTYVKRKTITVPGNYADGSVFRVKFSLMYPWSGGFTYGKIYKNGVPFGTEQSVRCDSPTGCTEYTEKSEDLAFSGGDTIELWVHTSGGTGYYKDFRVCCDNEACATWS